MVFENEEIRSTRLFVNSDNKGRGVTHFEIPDIVKCTTKKML
jgi:hypothetical protein